MCTDAEHHPYAKHWWPDAHVLGYVGPERGRFAWWLNLAAHTGEPVLIGFHGGSAAEELAAQTDDEIVVGAMTALRAMYG